MLAQDPSTVKPNGDLAREVVMLVDRAVDDLEHPVQDAPRELLEMPLNYLGLRLLRHGVDRSEPPPDVDPRRVAAIGTWFSSSAELPDWVWPWLERQTKAVRILHFGSIEPLARADRGARLRRHLGGLGLGYDSVVVYEPTRIETDSVATEAVPYESRPVYERVHHGPWNLDQRNKVWFLTRDRQRPRRARCPVVTGEFGGIALQPWFVRVGSSADDRRFYVDPFAFLSEALALDGLPAPDPSVRFGRRLFVLHLDGDGFESVSTVEEGELSAKVFLDRVIDRWQVPMTISFIIRSLTEELHPDEPNERMLLAREILSRPWVEAASHSVLHPLNWRRKLHPRSLPRSVTWYEKLGGFDPSMVGEVRESIAFINRWLVPDGRRCEIMLWSGAANPAVEALAAAAEAGCRNLNGGLFRWDELHDSVGFVSPWGSAQGEQFQVFVGAPNENIFPGFYTTMPGAFEHVDATIENTGGPRILKPANIYVHFYSAERPPRLAALEKLIERWLEQEPTFPAWASVYAAAVEDCHRSCFITRLDDGFAMRGFRHCRTIRFENEVPPIDWDRSRGIAGVRRRGGRTFVHLAADAAELRFRRGGVPQPRPHIEQADCELAGVVRERGSLRFTLPRASRRQVVVAGLPPQTEIEVEGLGALAEFRRSDGDGRLALRFPAGGPVAIRVSVTAEER